MTDTPICYVRDCDLAPIPRWPLCSYHAIQMLGDLNIEVGYGRDSVPMTEIIRDADEREARRKATAMRNGDIYALEINGLVKIGWSSDLIGRLRSYGPQVKVLCHFPGKRSDERDIHRAYKPLRANGREWYQDCAEIRRWIAEMIDKHGEPYAHGHWSEPTPQSARPRPKIANRRGRS